MPAFPRVIDHRRALALAAACALLSCARTSQDQTQSQTHWLSACQDSGDCGELSCICGTCTLACDEVATCDGTPEPSTCVSPDSDAAVTLCGEPAPSPVCLPTCEGRCVANQECVAASCVPIHVDPPGSGPTTDLARVSSPDPDCDECYVVNSAITIGPDGYPVIAGYEGEGTAARGFVRRFDGEQWRAMVELDSPSTPRDLWATEDELLVAVEDVTYRFAWNGQPGRDGPEAVALWGSERLGLHALGQQGLWREFEEWWTNTGEPLPGEPRALAGVDRDDAFRVCFLISEGRMHCQGEPAWSLDDPAPWDLRDLYVDPTGVVYAIAGRDNPDGTTGPGVIVANDGESWTELQAAPDDALLAITGHGERVYVVGGTRGQSGQATAVVWRGIAGRFERRTHPDQGFLWDVACHPSGACFAVGTDNRFIDLRSLGAFFEP